jgi:hypothetical protein
MLKRTSKRRKLQHTLQVPEKDYAHLNALVRALRVICDEIIRLTTPPPGPPPSGK